MIYCLGSFGIRLYHIYLWRETEIISRYVCKEKYRQNWPIVRQVCSMWKECGTKIRIESTTTRETNQTNPGMKHSQLTAVFSIVMTRNYIRLTKSTFHDLADYPRFSKIWPMLLIEALCKNVIVVSSRPPFCTFLIATRLASFRSGNFTGGLFLDLTQVEHKICRSSDLRIQRFADQHERSNDPKIQRSMVVTNLVLNSTKVGSVTSLVRLRCQLWVHRTR